jgi:signal transduction histidine kinase
MSDPNAEETGRPGTDRLLAYAADLELEVDRLRRHGTFLERETTATLLRVIRLCPTPVGDAAAAAALGEIEAAARALLEVVRDLHDVPGYHPAHDQVVAIAVRPLAGQVFRWQQRLTGARDVVLRLDLESDHVEWFPARLRHILDNLLAHALRHRDPAGAEPWVSVALRASDAGYELRVSDNGVWATPGEPRRGLALFYRAPVHEDGLGVGLAVVRMLVEQSGGLLTARPRPDRGTDVVLSLPRYDLLDYLD